MTALTIGRLKQVIVYDPMSGECTWLMSANGRVKVGARAGSVLNGLYRRVQIDGVGYLEHRLIWFYMTGEWPQPEVDHWDTDGLNNKWPNLREATTQQNGFNKGPNAANTTGYKGVTKRYGGKFRAQGTFNGKAWFTKDFVTAEQAAAAYVAKSSELHGAFARTGVGA